MTADITDMQAGKAGEYLVCADLILQGYVAFPSEQGLPFDVVAQVRGRLIKIQVKTIRRPSSRDGEPPLYIVSAMQCGKGGKSKYKAEDADVFAMVALDEKVVAYMHASVCKTCMQFRSESHRGQYPSERFDAAARRAASLRESGARNTEIAGQMGVTLNVVRRYLRAADAGRIRGKYLADFPFCEAVGLCNF